MNYLAALPFFLLPYDSLLWLVGAELRMVQTLPATSVLSVPYLILSGLRPRSSRQGRYLALRLGILFLILAITTLVTTTYEISVFSTEQIATRVSSGLRQGVSFFLGLTTFLMFQDALLRIGSTTAFRISLIAAAPTLALVVFQVASGVFRVQGFSSEPSHLADYLVWIVFPAVFLASVGRFSLTMVLPATSAALFVTYSTTGYIKAFLLAAIWALRRRSLVLMFLVIIFSVCSFFVILEYFPESYVSLVLNFMLLTYESTGNLNSTGSFIDRFYGIAGPVSMLSDARSWLGYGFGADSVYFESMFPASIAEVIRETKGDVPSIASLQGKLLLYGGVIGYLLYLLCWLTAWRSAPSGHPARVVLPALFVVTFFSLGPFFLPYVWFWLAAAVTTQSYRLDGV